MKKKDFDPIEYLRRSDKHYIGNGANLCYAPIFPKYQNKPGFCDELHFYDLQINTPLIISILDSKYSEFSFQENSITWTPAYFKHSLDNEDYLLEEIRGALEKGILFSQIEFKTQQKSYQMQNIVVWTIIPWDEFVDFEILDNGINIRRKWDPEETTTTEIFNHTIVCNQKPIQRIVILSEPVKNVPLFVVSPFPDVLRNQDTFKTSDVISIPKREIYQRKGCVFVGLVLKLSLEDLTTPFVIVAKYQFRDLDPSQLIPLENLPQKALNECQQFFASVPEFYCSDPYIEKAYWYRWYGIRLSSIKPPHPPPRSTYFHKYPVIYEGIEYFRRHISYSAQCHMLECRWMHNPRIAQGSLLGLVLPELSFPSEPGRIAGRVGMFRNEDMHYIADWGRVSWETFLVQGDRTFLEASYNPLVKYAEYLLKHRDPEQSGLFSLVNQWETGQEHNSRYGILDHGNEDLVINLKGVDLTTYTYNLFFYLEKIALTLERKEEATRWRKEAQRVRNAILSTMWNGDKKEFFDVLPKLHQQTMVEVGTNFYPLFTDMAEDHHFLSLEHLFNEKFWTEYPIASEAISEKLRSCALWKKVRRNCPWQGRVWPMLNSHIAEVLFSAAEKNPENIPKLKQFLIKFIRLLFFDQDVSRPNTFEHYNPLNGYASEYRGIDDYQHSWLVDLIIRFIAGIHPTVTGFKISPVNFQLEYFYLKNLYLRGNWIDLIYQETETFEYPAGLSIYINGELEAFIRDLPDIIQPVFEKIL
ncbi:MAG: hypothetical protein JSV04_07860 [Candidatus Heimdallarchaeota archaeon]|nr:MAG: hypothetical protein JSV04_07860 [Candidatus Heimdallarchaeota archaeon]